MSYFGPRFTPFWQSRVNDRSVTTYWRLAPIGLSLALGLLGPSSTQAQELDFGASGVDGSLFVDTDTVLPVPPDGVFRFSDIFVAEGATLSFELDPLYTPAIVFNVAGDVVVDGRIDVGGDDGMNGIGGLGGPGGPYGASASLRFGALRWVRGSLNYSSSGDGVAARPGLSGGNAGTPTDECPVSGAGGGAGGALTIFASGSASFGPSSVLDASGGAGEPLSDPGCTESSFGSAGTDGDVHIFAQTIQFEAGSVVVGSVEGAALVVEGGTAVTASGARSISTFGTLRAPQPDEPSGTLISVDGELLDESRHAFRIHDDPSQNNTSTSDIVIEISECPADALSIQLLLTEGSGFAFANSVADPLTFHGDVGFYHATTEMFGIRALCTY